MAELNSKNLMKIAIIFKEQSNLPTSCGYFGLLTTQLNLETVKNQE